MERLGDYWRFTTLSTRKLLEETFETTDVRVEAYGNVLEDLFSSPVKA